MAAMSGALLLLATTGAYADTGMKLLCTRDNDRQWVHVVINVTKNVVWDDFKPGVAHDGPYRQFALTIVSGWPMSNTGATMSWGNAVLVGNVDLTETDGGTLQFKCHGTTAGNFPGDEPHP